MWSCGAILCDMFTGSTPNLARSQWDINPVLPTLDMPEGAKRVVGRLMIPVPAQRDTALQVLQDPWVMQGLTPDMLQMNDIARQNSPDNMDIDAVSNPL